MEVREITAVSGRGSNTVWQAVTLAVFCLAYLAIVHYPNSFCGIMRLFLVLLSTEGQTGSVDSVASYTYIGLPSVILFSALVTRRERTQIALALAAKIVAGIAIFIALPDLLLTPFLVGTGGYVVFGAVAGLVGIEGGVVSGVINLESSGVEAPDRRPRHGEAYHKA